MVKGGKRAATTMTKHAGGRPRMSADEKLVRVAARMRPGDVEKLVAAAHRRGIPTGSLLRDWTMVLLVYLEHPSTVTRAAVESLRADLGFDQVEAGEKPPTTRLSR
jgi:hypothetical protein